MTPDTKINHISSLEEIKTAYETKQGLLWVDISETTDDDASILKNVFNFHHLAIEDCLSQDTHPPKIDDFGNYLFFIIHGINYATTSEIV